MILSELGVRTGSRLPGKPLSITFVSVTALISSTFSIAIILILLVLFKVELLPLSSNASMTFEVALINACGG